MGNSQHQEEPRKPGITIKGALESVLDAYTEHTNFFFAVYAPIYLIIEFKISLMEVHAQRILHGSTEKMILEKIKRGWAQHHINQAIVGDLDDKLLQIDNIEVIHNSHNVVNNVLRNTHLVVRVEE